ncbi:MAG: transketolase [Magnetococcales bacterium]|nr:transketolase [Magnetococcales bacterium]
MHLESHVGHVGGNLSALDALLCLHHQVMGPDDRFVLSKGHAAGALYVTLWTTGVLDDAQLHTFHRDGTRLAGHPMAGWIPAIPVSTGSLGHGLSLAVGMAMARRLQGRPGAIYCLTSDGEWQEGAMWEALILARHQRVNHLTVLVDVNGLQGFGTTDEVASLADLAPRMTGFGVGVVTVDGHDPEAIRQAVVRQDRDPDGPRVVLLRTIKGKGVSRFENRLESHYLPLSPEDYAQALAVVGEEP